MLNKDGKRWHQSILGWERDMVALDWYGRAIDSDDAINLSKAMMEALWMFLLRAQGLKERMIPNDFLYSYMAYDLGLDDAPGYRLIIDPIIVSTAAKGNRRKSFDTLPIEEFTALIEQLAWSDETVRRHVLEKGPVEIRAAWRTYDDKGIWLDFWMADRDSRIMLGVSERTATTLLLMLAHCCGLFRKSTQVEKVKLLLERPHSATLMATFPQRHGPDKPQLLLDYCDRMGLADLKAQFSAVLL